MTLSLVGREAAMMFFGPTVVSRFRHIHFLYLFGKPVGCSLGLRVRELTCSGATGFYLSIIG